MFRGYITLLAVFLIMAFVLFTTALFTDNWVVGTRGRVYHINLGIVPYNTALSIQCRVASIIMYVAFVFFFPLILLFSYVCWQFVHHGSSQKLRIPLFAMLFFSIIIVAGEIFTFITFMTSGQNEFNYDYAFEVHVPYSPLKVHVGYSVYLELASTIVLILASIVNIKLAVDMSRV